MERIVAIRKNGVELPGVLNDVTTADHRAQITLNYNQTSLTKMADDFFDALRQIRLELETQNAMILYNGARIDAYPSGMSRQMSLGRIVYLNQTGQPAKHKAAIFDKVDADWVASVAEQDKYHCDWLASLSQ